VQFEVNSSRHIGDCIGGDFLFALHLQAQETAARCTCTGNRNLPFRRAPLAPSYEINRIPRAGGKTPLRGAAVHSRKTP